MNKFTVTTDNSGGLPEISADYFVIEKEYNAVLFCEGPYYGMFPKIVVKSYEREQILKTNIIAYVPLNSIKYIRKLNE